MQRYSLLPIIGSHNWQHAYLAMFSSDFFFEELG